MIFCFLLIMSIFHCALVHIPNEFDYFFLFLVLFFVHFSCFVIHLYVRISPRSLWNWWPCMCFVVIAMSGSSRRTLFSTGKVSPLNISHTDMRAASRYCLQTTFFFLLNVFPGTLFILSCVMVCSYRDSRAPRRLHRSSLWLAVSRR